MDSRTYRIGPSTVELIFGDLTRSRAEVVVSSDDAMLSQSGGVSGAIGRAGGPSITVDAGKHTGGHREPLAAGDVVVTTGGGLPAKYVLHAVTIASGRVEAPGPVIVRRATSRVLELLPALGCRSVAFPAIGTGVAGIPYEDVAAEMATTIVSTLLRSDWPYRVEPYLYDRWNELQPRRFFERFERQVRGALAVETTPAATETVVAPPSTAPSAVAARHTFAVVQQLVAQRDGLEADLLRLLADNPVHLPAEVVATVQQQLQLVQGLIAMYLGSAPQPGTVAADREVPRSVFVSSTRTDLGPERGAARGAIEAAGWRFVGMENFPPSSMPPAEYIQAAVVRAEVYLGIIGFRYGSVEKGSGRSMTEFEYRRARTAGKPVLLFVLADDAPITAAMLDADPENYRKVLAFRWELLDSHVCRIFRGPDDLARDIRHALSGQSA